MVQGWFSRIMRPARLFSSPILFSHYCHYFRTKLYHQPTIIYHTSHNFNVLFLFSFSFTMGKSNIYFYISAHKNEYLLSHHPFISAMNRELRRVGKRLITGHYLFSMDSPMCRDRTAAFYDNLNLSILRVKIVCEQRTWLRAVSNRNVTVSF